jgi:HD-like signal output (HDOD) protein
VSACARRAAEFLRVSPKEIDDAVTAGLLHDTGKLVLASCMAAEYKMALDMAAQTAVSLAEAERDVFGIGQAEVGGYLLSLWGLPDGIVEAVGWHPNPYAAPSGAAAALTAVHAACVYHSALNPSTLAGGAVLDSEYLYREGFEGREQALFDACGDSSRSSRRC